MKRQLLALKHLKENGTTFGQALAAAIGVSTNNLSTTMKPLVKIAAVTKGHDRTTRASTWTITKKGTELVDAKNRPTNVAAQRIDPSDPFGLFAQLQASRTLSRHRTAPIK